MSEWNLADALKRDYPWANDDQIECMRMFCDLCKGYHHIQGKFKDWGRGIAINSANGWWATYDFDNLTMAVLMAHDRCIRLDIEPSGPGRIKFILHKRKGREGQMHERHPTIEQAIEQYRKRWAE